MRFGGLILALLLLPLVACKALPEGGEKPPGASSEVDGIAETALSGGKVKPSIRPKTRPNLSPDAGAADPQPIADAPTADELPSVAPVVVKSREQIACEKRGGNWANAGKSTLKTCIKRTRDAGKQCRKATDCESACLARSGSCAPLKPLLGCNEILQKDGSRVTLCID